MPPGEFDIIARYFAGLTPPRDDIRLGIGDDAAVLVPPPGCELVVATDTLVEGVHFPASTPADAIGHKALAVNLSDLAAMGAEPAWSTLALTLPAADEAWLTGFAAGLGRLARESGIALVGGDITRGPLTIGVTVMGFTEPGTALTRRGAAVGDRLYVSGTLGAPAAALAIEAGWPCPEANVAGQARAALDYPSPRLELGRRLRGLASAAIDVSDGLRADAGHLARASGCGAELWVDRLPRAAAVTALSGPDHDEWVAWPLAGGDEYELCFSVPEGDAGAVDGLAGELGLPLTWIGRLTEPGPVVCRHNDGREYVGRSTGYNHFAPEASP